MARAIILDYHGVIVNDEPLHKNAFQRVLGEEGIRLDDDEYFTRYLGISDRDITIDVLKRLDPAGRPNPGNDGGERVDHLLARKALAYRDLVKRHLPEAPGAADFIRAAAGSFPIAVASGALRIEVEDGLYRLGIRDCITAVVTSEEVSRGKPHPEIFLRARELLVRICNTPGAPLGLALDEPAAAFLVVEDSPAGLAAARAAWMPAIGITTSRPAEEMKPAARVIADLSALAIGEIEGL
jgi:beta-phosphoglucomutase-like phosphatase (HAD superfamily)